MVPAWREYVPLAPYTTLHVGGCARYFTIVTSLEMLHQAVAQARKRGLPFVVLGGGSNVLVSEQGYPGLVIRMAINDVTEHKVDTGVWVTAGAGVEFDELVATTVTHGWWGLENLSHIPGTVGATPIQNVGAYGVEVADIISSVTVYDTERGVVHELSNSECQFGYRTSRFKTDVEKRMIVTAVTYKLSTKATHRVEYADLARYFSGQAPDSPGAVRDAVIAIRGAKFPNWHTVGTAGSFFKNPIIPHSLAENLLERYPQLPCYPAGPGLVKCSLGYLLDKVCGLRGYRSGLVRLYEAQALVLVADRGATATAIDAFATDIAQQVFSKTGIIIEREVQSL